MQIEAINAVSSAVETLPTTSIQVHQPDFKNAVSAQLGKVDESLKTAEHALAQLAAGAEIPVHEVMISMESARLDLMLLSEVRNRVVEAYQELSRMQL